MKKSRMSSVALLAIAVGSSTLSGCAMREVKAWERGVLAEKEMAWEPDPMLASYRRHVEFSKEAATGGPSLGGGGCGCN